ncbi:phosphodiester glycosidase family protein [Catenulispora acidiphila]|uniref:phosphodiester glycosidase family protein n=1 Tax=Catenulispora acidiphila TaxID=304895 RepID=UPI00019E02DE|nr:phosphodiester glycosidase family protein [Catenulispora acidiphila]
MSATVVAALVCGALAGTGGASAQTSGTDDTAAHSGGGDGRPWLPPTPDQWPLVVTASNTAQQEITRGIDYQTDTYQTVGGVQHSTELNVDLSDPNVRLGVVESHNEINDAADEVPSSMANRTGAVAGINGDFFDIYGSGSPHGMVVIDGRLVKSPNPAWNQNVVVRADGSIGMGAEAYSGTATDGAASHPITSVNTVADLSANGLVRITPDLGDSGKIPASVVATGHRDPADASVLIIDAVTPNVTDITQVPAGTEDLVGSGTAGQWLTATAHPGDRVTIAESISPDNAPRQALSGGAILVQNGTMAVPVQGSGENNVNNPVTGMGVTKDGKHAIVAVFDGHQPEDAAEGLTRPQLAGWMIAHGAYNAMVFDSGGSSEMVARQPGQQQVSVSNTPSDGHERPVANGLFFYSTEPHPAPAVRAVANSGAPLAVLTNSTVPVGAYAVDTLGNPASDPVTLSVHPSSRASISTGTNGATLTASGTPGTGELVATAGRAHSSVPLRVTDHLSSLTLSPATADLNNGGTQQLSVSATTRDKQPVSLLPASVAWTASPPNLGSVDPTTGLFTAATDDEGLVTVTASVDGASATTSIAVGQRTEMVDTMTDVNNWAVNTHGGATGSLSLSTTTKRLPTDAGSMDVKYDIPAGSGVKQVVFSPTVSESFPPAGETQLPDGVGIWIKGSGTGGSGTPLGLGNLTLAEAYTEVNGQYVDFYPSTVTYDGWQLIVANLPAGLQFPMSVKFLDFLVISPTQTLSGDLYVSDLQALYSPRPLVTPPYVAIPDNPSWLQFTEDPAKFRAGGTTLAALDDAHTHADDPNSTGSVVLKQDGTQIKALPSSQTGALSLQTMGDMSDTGSTANLTYLKSLLDGTGVPYHEGVGNHEITQGADPENKNWTSLFGATHYSYTQGAANILVTDSSHIGILPSDPYQVPAGDPPQYQWLADQLSANRSPVVFVVSHVPAYDPHPQQDSQFADRWEAQMFETLVQKYQDTHPHTHVITLFGHARGWAENLLDPTGHNTAGGIPNFVVADAGVEAYAPPAEGGFYNYGLFHVLPNGDVQFAAIPTLAGITVSSPASTLQAGQSTQLTATGTTPTGDDLPALSVPIADPASHVWRSSDPHVATVDPVTGAVHAWHAGTATVTVTSDGISGSVTLTVTKG